MIIDMLGAQVEPGDVGVYVTSGRYTTRGVVEVLTVKVKARVRWLKADRALSTAEMTESFVINTGSLIIVEKFKGRLSLGNDE